MHVIPLKSGFHEISPKEADMLQKRFPGLDVRQQLSHMVAWCEANPARRKTPRGINRFVTSWLIRASERKPDQTHAASHKPMQKGIERTTEADKRAAEAHLARLQAMIDSRKT